jgi:VIT1/CCC1 family predicted Fe2+/Mn2+ transporter
MPMTGNAPRQVLRAIGLTLAISALCGGAALALQEKISPLSDYQYKKDYAQVEEIRKEEKEHEKQLISMIDEEKLKYMGSVVLGLNDALVEFTGALAGFTLAMQNSRLIGMAGLIMGFSASLSIG